MKISDILKTVIISLLLLSCNFSEPADTNQDDIIIITEKIIDDVFPSFNHYSICGTFYYQLEDTVLNNSLHYLDSLLTKDDISLMIKQFNIHKGKNLDKYIDTSRFVTINQIDSYAGYKFHKLHLSMSPPMFSVNKNLCVIYLHSFSDIGQGCIFFLFEKKNNTWNLKLRFIDTAIEDSFVSVVHYHDYSLVLPEELAPIASTSL